MKNSLNLVLVVIIGFILACKCETSTNYNNKTNKPATDSTAPSPSSESDSPSSSNSVNAPGGKKTGDDDFDKEMDELDKTIDGLKPGDSVTVKPKATPKPADDDEDPPPAKGGKIPTMQQFNSVKKGMSYDDVVDLLGSDGTLIKEQGAMKRYIWGDQNSFIMISFDNGRVSIATQENLN